jgi:hypothetical protein
MASSGMRQDAVAPFYSDDGSLLFLFEAEDGTASLCVPDFFPT